MSQASKGAKKPDFKFATKTLHAAWEGDPKTGATTPPIYPSASYVTPKNVRIFSAYEYDPEMGYSYSRWGSPTVRLLERRLSALEGADDCVVFSSGMAAATGLFIQQLKAGDRLALGNVCYPGIAEFSHDTLAKFKVEVDYFDPSDPASAEAAIKDGTKLVFIDTPANPIIRLGDIPKIAGLAHARGAKLAVDSTFATPVATKPLELGADFVMHSLTKYLNGHGDVLGGAILGAKDDMKVLRTEGLMHLGSNLGAFEAWLVLRGLETLWPRMIMHQENAKKAAAFLEGHPKVARVFYPGLASHPQHGLAKRQMKNFSGMVSFRLKGGQKAANQFLGRLRILENAVSLGKTKSLIYFISTDELQRNSYKLPEGELAKYLEWAGDGVIRFSVGLEDPDDILEDLEQALAGVS